MTTPYVSRRGFLRGSAAATAVPAAFGSLEAHAAEEALNVVEARAAQRSGDLVIVDIRRPEEWAATGVPRGAHRIDMRARDFPARLVSLRQARPDARVGLICATGGRSAAVNARLREMGIDWTVDVRGGVVDPNAGWIARGLPTEH